LLDCVHLQLNMIDPRGDFDLCSTLLLNTSDTIVAVYTQ
jgi:hypothetical protein